jgi:small subunit ribosomal protein S9
MNKKKNILKAIGRRKNAIAIVHLEQGQGQCLINNKICIDYFSNMKNEIQNAFKPIIICSLKFKKFSFNIKVKGGGVSSQLEAIRLGLSRILSKKKLQYRILLKKKFYLRRDSRIKERKKYGLKKARKASQYSKR